MSSSTASSFSGCRPRWTSPPSCVHGVAADTLTSYTEENHGRRYFCCPIRKWDDCNFFQWLHWPESTSFCRNYCERRIDLQMLEYGEQIYQAQEVEKSLIEQLRLKEEEFDALKAEFEVAIKVEVSKNLTALKKVGLLLLILTILIKIAFA